MTLGVGSSAVQMTGNIALCGTFDSSKGVSIRVGTSQLSANPSPSRNEAGLCITREMHEDVSARRT